VKHGERELLFWCRVTRDILQMEEGIPGAVKVRNAPRDG
jgi:hypothetical protein